MVAGSEAAAPQISSSQMSVSIWNISSRAMWSASWMPWGDLTNAAVVCAASVGKSMNFAIRVVRMEMGRNMVKKLTKRAAKVAKFEFFRKGCT